ncbi:MAG: hypothetical protein Rsou_0777 [Candidatus Ruthia sp. Asou_11_S2]|nr:hypothetical protein [Candidatus Ruthia sp. Asou_11_S2]
MLKDLIKAENDLIEEYNAKDALAKEEFRKRKLLKIEQAEREQNIQDEYIESVSSVAHTRLEELKKIVGDVERLIKEIERIESAADSTEILIEDITEMLSIPLIEGMRQLGIYNDPNGKKVKKFKITELFNFEDIRANSQIASRSEYISMSDKHYINYSDNIKKLRSGFVPLVSSNDYKEQLRRNGLKAQTYNLFTHVLGHDYHKFAGRTFDKDVVTIAIIGVLQYPV